MIHIKTVLSLNYQHRLLKKYKKILTVPQSQMLRHGAKLGFMFGFGMMLIMLTIGTSMYAQDVILLDIAIKETV